MRVDDALIDLIFDAFVAVLPATVSVTKTATVLCAETTNADEAASEYRVSSIGYRRITLPYLPLSKRRRSEREIAAYVTTLTYLVQQVLEETWPPGAGKVRVSLSEERDVRVWFGTSDYESAEFKLAEVRR